MSQHLRLRWLCLAALVSPGFSFAGDEPPAYKPEALILYQATQVANKRMGPHVEAIADYVKKIEAKAVEHLKALPKGKGQTFLIIVVLKPDKKVHLWCTHGGEDITPKALAEMQKKMEDVPAPETGKNLLAFALHSSLWGGPAKKVTKPPFVPDELLFPKEWVEAAKKKGKTLSIPLSDDDLRLVCPE